MRPTTLPQNPQDAPAAIRLSSTTEVTGRGEEVDERSERATGFPLRFTDLSADQRLNV